MQAAMMYQGASDSAVLLLTGPVDPLVMMLDLKWRGRKMTTSQKLREGKRDAKE